MKYALLIYAVPGASENPGPGIDAEQEGAVMEDERLGLILSLIHI